MLIKPFAILLTLAAWILFPSLASADVPGLSLANDNCERYDFYYFDDGLLDGDEALWVYYGDSSHCGAIPGFFDRNLDMGDATARLAKLLNQKYAGTNLDDFIQRAFLKRLEIEKIVKGFGKSIVHGTIKTLKDGSFFCREYKDTTNCDYFIVLTKVNLDPIMGDSHISRSFKITLVSDGRTIISIEAK